ncbi:MAG: hypothetical protein JGK29_27050, partial [Microcoleus sp. PH2017_17_BER_D_A]|nr:hypothetical protein [Microcoleus sp. PH2017_17_BER_D_A]
TVNCQLSTLPSSFFLLPSSFVTTVNCQLSTVNCLTYRCVRASLCRS